MKDDITPREMEVLELIANGYTDKEIREKLFIAQSTLNSHKECLYQKTFIYDNCSAATTGKRIQLALFYLTQKIKNTNMDELKRIKLENELITKQYNNLLSQYNKVLKDNCNNRLQKYRSALEEINKICKCSKEPMNCDECPQCDDCEELCVNDENLQDIILDKINEVLQ